jgi:hypothetical protein
MNTENQLKVIKKVLMGYSFNKNGYEYHFISIEPDEKGCLITLW